MFLSVKMDEKVHVTHVSKGLPVFWDVKMDWKAYVRLIRRLSVFFMCVTSDFYWMLSFSVG